MNNALHDYAELFERYAANNGGTGAILAGEDCLALANEMRMDADDIDAENAKLRKLVRELWDGYMDPTCEECHLKDTPTCADCPICAREAAVIDHMRELGIEVE